MRRLNKGKTKRTPLLPAVAYERMRVKGSGVSVGKLNVYNPTGRRITDDIKKKILGDKTFLVFHITGNIEKINSLLGRDIVYDIPKSKKNLTDGFYWYNMPSYREDKKNMYPIIYIGFLSNKDKFIFANLLGINIKENTRWVHYPKPVPNKNDFQRYKITYKINPKYPIYIISKGRWKKRLTSKACENAGIPYKIVVEPDEYDNYAEVIDPKKILKAPMNFSKLKKGSIPVRNFVWEHAVKSGKKKHWILDDNIDGFYRWNLNI